MQIRTFRNGLLSFLALICLVQSTMAQKSPCAGAPESGLPLPSSFLPARLSQFQAQLKIENWKLRIATASQTATLR